MFEQYDEIAQLTPEQENIVRKYVDHNTFDVEAMLDYLRSHETVEFEIFPLCNKGEKVNYTYLRSFHPISRNTVIRRLVIYFYDLNRKSDDVYMSDLFEDYADFLYPMPERDGPYIVRRNESRFTQDMDFEKLYVLLEKIIYEYKIPLDRVFHYLITCFGEPIRFKFFYHWTNFIDLLDKADETNVFPNNLYYALNTELVKHDKGARFTLPNYIESTPSYNSEAKELTLNVSGYFPVNDKGEVVMEWVGLWLENCGEIRIAKIELDPNDIETFFLAGPSGSNLINLVVPVNPDSRVFALRRKKDSTGKYVNKWIQVYCGSRVSKFTFKPLVTKREELKLSQKEVAELADINLRSYQRIEKGESTPDALNLIELMSILDINDTKSFIARPEIIDDDYSKFKSGKMPSEYIDEN